MPSGNDCLVREPARRQISGAPTDKCCLTADQSPKGCMRNDWHPWKNPDPATPAESRALKIEFALLLTLVVGGFAASLLSAIGIL
jgi:hypothetical protein